MLGRLFSIFAKILVGKTHRRNIEKKGRFMPYFDVSSCANALSWNSLMAALINSFDSEDR
jgi:hypothetical protein